ncbi:AAHS family cis,cis-muconate transporter-like MFS transporter [Acinetobacter baylyi]|uniref:AAHS family cis,cis-muconate transporter-like MFS transporter n=1 Tax=Acinetobacter baylyi TaxID=202950 RepID=A0ABU0UTH9_ACIBI|nr:MFS transporter [Acinetobacter baylyi]MDQ1207613.1 AAHS family cis,cis-muconate transporter-like MFS transporter [Acinetobacter baylyi]MDR6105311.1 AAHS family cis,cis-muconate transporter-like MFS transporter [Acinetobacter baylyi]MDR6184482.1 AAHS family cis,cis-muconate transporter-like MFS transporter [Acinetobacter baylyi]
MYSNNQRSRIGSHTWKIAFLFAFLALLVDGADLMLLSYSLNSIKAEFNLSTVEAGMLGSFTLAGMAIGGIFGGWACDRFGRVRIVVISILTFSILTCGLGLTQSFIQFGVLRFFASLGLGSLYIACNTLMAEYVPTKYRTTVLGTLQAGWTVGYIVATLLAGWLIPDHGWRVLFYVAIIPVLMAVLMHFFVPEPAAWQQSRLVPSKQTETVKTSAFKLIFQDKRNRNMFILWALTAGFLQFGYYGVNNWMPSYLESELGMKFKEMTAYMVGTYTAMILGKILAGFMADKLGRRFTYAFGAIGTAIFLPLIVFYNSPDNILYLLVIFGFLYGIPYGVNATYMTESFPTAIRGTAIGGAYNVGRLGAAIAPATIGFLASGGSIGLGFVVMGAAYFICGVIPALFIKEKQYDPQQS